MGPKNFERSGLCLVNGNIITLDPNKPKAEAVAIQ
jgi:predicted amidohydrolase YtcJ